MFIHSQDIEQIQILTSIKGRNPVVKLRKKDALKSQHRSYQLQCVYKIWLNSVYLFSRYLAKPYPDVHHILRNFRLNYSKQVFTIRSPLASISVIDLTPLLKLKITVSFFLLSLPGYSGSLKRINYSKQIWLSGSLLLKKLIVLCLFQELAMEM